MIGPHYVGLQRPPSTVDRFFSQRARQETRELLSARRVQYFDLLEAR